jgi:chromate reductase, NAD(P)H dehydrogenase (quinone)
LIFNDLSTSAIKITDTTMKKKKILVLLGSTKWDSVNQKIVDYFVEKTKAFFDVKIYPLSILPYFNPDLETDLLPDSVRDFREKIEQADGVLVSTPEYVFSIPGILKNALEWTVSTIVFNEKPTAIITAASSGNAAHESIQLILKTIGANFDENCAILIQSPKSKMNIHGDITDTKTIDLLANLILNFKKHIG